MIEEKFSSAPEPVKKEEPPKLDGPRDELIIPEVKPIASCPNGKRVSKGKTGNAKALMKICGG